MNDPFIDDRKPPSKSVPIGDKKHTKKVIPVTTKMVNSDVSECNQFVLKYGCQLYLVKFVGAIMHYHKYWNNFIMEIENETGRI